MSIITELELSRDATNRMYTEGNARGFSSNALRELMRLSKAVAQGLSNIESMRKSADIEFGPGHDINCSNISTWRFYTLLT